MRYEEEILPLEGGETLAQVAQRSCGCPLPGSVQGQVGWSSEQPGLVEDVPAQGKEGWNRMIFKVPSNPNHSMILWFLEFLQDVRTTAGIGAYRSRITELIFFLKNLSLLLTQCHTMSLFPTSSSTFASNRWAHCHNSQPYSQMKEDSQ